MGFSDILQDAVSQAVSHATNNSGGNNNNNQGGSNQSYGGDSYGDRPSYGGNQGGYNDRPSQGNQGGYNDRPSQSYGGDSYGGNQGGYNDRPSQGYGGDSYGDRPSHGGNQGGYNDRPSHGGNQGGYNDTSYNAPPPSHGGYHNSNPSSQGFSDNDVNPALRHAQQHHSDSDSNDSSLFSTALNFLKDKQGRSSSPDIDESDMVQSHQQLYNDNDSSRAHDSNSLGAGAAIQALKMFSSGQSGGSSGGDQNAFIGMAMSQAAKLWDQKNSSGKVVCYFPSPPPLPLSIFFLACRF